jgi:tRNA 2-thiouridine synthesizing protein B
MLHTLSCAPGHPAVKECIALLRANDALLLLGDGVYIALQHSEDWLALQQSGASLHVLDADARAAGVRQRLAGCFTVVDDDGFVSLTEQHAQQMAWY